MADNPDALGALVALNRFGLGARPGDLADQFGLSAAVQSDKVFPDSANIKPMPDLVV